MIEFSDTLRSRIGALELSLAAARRDGDEHLAEIEQAALDELLRIAREHGVDAA